MGTPDFSLPALKILISSEYEVVAVYTQPDKLAGRGRMIKSSPVKQAALDNGILVFQPENFRDLSEVERLANLKPDVIIAVAFGQILPQQVLDIPKYGCLNIHPSLLPKYRGASPVASAILAGDKETGVSIMLLDSGMDTGPVLAPKKVSIDNSDTTESLELKLAKIGSQLLIETLPKWFEHELQPERQYTRDAIYTKQISKKDGELDWYLPAVELERRIRAFYPWPGCYTRWNGKMLKVLEAVVLPDVEQSDPGVVISLPSNSEVPVGVGTGDGVLGLRRVQLEGKKVNYAVEFLRGYKGFVGEKLE